MLVLTGVFENERFIPDRPVSIPQRQKITVTIDDGINTKLELEKAAELLYNDYKNDKKLTEFTCLDSKIGEVTLDEINEVKKGIAKVIGI